MGTTGRTVAATSIALILFAANSLLCRMALGADAVDAASYSTLRIASGAITLLLIGFWRSGARTIGGSWSSAFLLFCYAVPFSFAYVGLTTGTGALILFGCVQLTMLLAGWRAGERFRTIQWTGFLLALMGLGYLLMPGVQAPPLLEALLMAIAGIAWGWYSLRGRAAGDPFLRTKGNFIRAVPMVLLVSVFAWPSQHLEPVGVLLAIVSGAIASAFGYVAWYAALMQHNATQASVLQLLVPVLAALSGVLVLGEPFGLRLGVASVLVLGGVGLAMRRKA